MKFELVSLDGVKFSEDAYSVVLPTASGEITVMPDHEPLLSVVVPGVISIRRSKTNANIEHFATYGGVLEVGEGYARVLVDEATHGDDVNEAEAEKAHQAALTLRKNAKDQIELDKAQAMVDRQSVRLAVAQVRRRNRR